MEEQTLISRKTIGEYRTDPYAKPDFGSVLALCIGLNLSFNFSYDLIKKAGQLPRLEQDDCWIYMDLLTHKSNTNIHYWNEYLLKAGVDRIPKEHKAKEFYEDFW